MNTVTDHITVIRAALAQLPGGRSGFCLPGDPASIHAKLAAIRYEPDGFSAAGPIAL